MRRVNCTLRVADNERKNVNFPTSSISENIFTNSVIYAFVFQKIDPSKDFWGDITIEVNVKDPKSRITTTSTYN